MKLNINEPCHEDWDKMKIGLHSRHCEVCVKSVIDFTQMSRAEIITHILSNPNEQVCGRMRPDQFDFRHEDIPVLVEVLKTKPSNHAFLIMALVCLSLSSCAQESNTHPPVNGQPVEQPIIGKMVAPPTPPDTVTNKPAVCTPDSLDYQRMVKGEVVLQGDITVREPAKNSSDRVLQFAEKMPEYPGGMENMFNYIQSYFSNKKITQKGTIYVRFVVQKTGYLTSIELLSVPDHLSYLSKDVIKMVEKMPAWIPGAQDGKSVDVYYTIPVRFE